jgi:hypothetical protein
VNTNSGIYVSLNNFKCEVLAPNLMFSIDINYIQKVFSFPNNFRNNFNHEISEDKNVSYLQPPI